MSSENPNHLVIDLRAAVRNFAEIRGLVRDTGAQIMPVVKSDAYGHGMVRIVRALEKRDGIWGFGISNLEEAVILRQNGVSARLMLMSGVWPGSEEDVLGLDVIAGVTDMAALERLEKKAGAREIELAVHLKVDTGMGRFGLSRKDLLKAVAVRSSWPHLRFEGLYSHLSSADVPEDPFNRIQIRSFQDILDAVRKLGWQPSMVHLANSAGTIHFPGSHYNMVRPGLAFYGCYPGEASRKFVQLSPVMEYKSRVACVRESPGQFPVGYGHSFVTSGPSRIAVVPVGYDHGYMRALSNRANVLIRGERCRVVGRISMKALMVDVTRLKSVSVGEEVVLIGSQGAESITLEELAGHAGTISYELMCLLGRRNRKKIKE
ncbi:MAG TPA: alanine racemase [Thermodesulfobacteriaceae bacterium]|nr:alanine racemase [Thermodesulfobacteriaceae bacterium]